MNRYKSLLLANFIVKLQLYWTLMPS